MLDDSFSINDFTTGDWQDRPKYSELGGIPFDHLCKIHGERSRYELIERCGGTRVYVFLHISDEITFNAYCYQAFEQDSTGKPSLAEPVIWVYGTSFDGVREISGSQNVVIQLQEMAKFLLGLQEFFCRRWQSFAEWYDASAR